MQTTTNIGLKTYEANDPTDWLGEFNYNMNKIDTAVGSQNDAIDVIEETAGTALTTANTASTTANTALTTANSKASINDNVASATTTYSSNKINELIQPGTEITNFTILTTDWVTNTDVSTNTDYPFICNKTSDKFSNTSKPIYQFLGTGTIPTVDELNEAGYIAVVNFSTSGVTMYATEKPLNTLTLIVRGFKYGYRF